MIKNKLLLTLIFVVIFILKTAAHGCISFHKSDCHLDPDNSLAISFQRAVDRHVSRKGWDTGDEVFNKIQLSVITDPRYQAGLDAVFSVAKNTLLKKFGPQNFCERVLLSPDGFYFKISENNNTQADKKLEGSFRFIFHHQPLSSSYSSGPNTTLNFKFEETESGIFSLIESPQLPDCTEQNCTFERPSNLEIGEKAIAMGLIDGSENFRVRKESESLIALEEITLFYDRQVFLFDMKKGAYKGKRIEKMIAREGRSLEDYVRRSARIVDATCIRTEIFFAADKQFYTNFFYRPHHTLKGEKNRQIFAVARPGTGVYWSHQSPDIFDPGSRVLLFLAPVDSSQFALIGHAVDTTQFSQWQAYQTSFTFPFGGQMKPYHDLFPILTELSNSEFYRYDNVNETSQRIRKWLSRFHRRELINQHGLSVAWKEFSWSENLDEIGTGIILRSTKDYAYLLEKEFIIQYDTSKVSPYGIKNKTIKVSKFLQKPFQSSKGIPKALLTKNYEITSEDVAADQFKIMVKAKNDKNLSQLNTEKEKNTQPETPIFTLKFKLKNQIDKDSFALTLMAKPFEKSGKHYDFFTKKEKDFAYQYLPVSTVYAKLSDAYPLIHAVYPTTYQIGDTITITGENLANFADHLRCPCAVTERNITFQRHCKVQKENIIQRSYHQISFTVPQSFYHKKFKSIGLLPSTGTIKMKDEQSNNKIQFRE